MKHQDVVLKCLALFIITLFSPLFADSTPNPYSCVIDPEFSNTDLIYAPLAAWASAGSNAVTDSVFSINVTAIPDSAKYAADDSLYSIPSAVPNNNLDDHLSLQELINWLSGRPWLQGIHTQIYIPPGIYNFNDQIVMGSNISLKGAGSHQTELRFLINADTTDTTMTTLDCRKDAILISGSDDAYKYNCGIEDLKIERIRNGISEGEVKDYVGGHDTEGTQGEGITEGVECYYANQSPVLLFTQNPACGVSSV